ncbi:hypothetical protein BLA29_015469, partial [Euroglyphus maynei]
MDKELMEIGDHLPMVEMERAELERWLLLESVKINDANDEDSKMMLEY